MKDTKKVAKLNYLAPAILMVVSRVPYMIIQKVTPETIDPYVSLCLCYGVSYRCYWNVFFNEKRAKLYVGIEKNQLDCTCTWHMPCMYGRIRTADVPYGVESQRWKCLTICIAGNCPGDCWSRFL